MVQVTHVRADEEESRREATLLLGIDGLRFVDVTQDDGGIRHVQVVTDDPGAVACPACGVFSTSIKGHAVTAPRDIPYGARPIHLSWRKRRWRCQERLCARASFTESVPAVPARSRVTTRLRAQCGAGIAQRFTCVLAGAAYYGLSWPVAHQGYVAHVSAVLAQPLPPVAVLGIDETRRGKVQWLRDSATGRWSVAAGRWHTGVVDAAGTGGLLAHIEGRTAAKVSHWLNAQPQEWRAGITHVTIDLSDSYLKAVTDALAEAVVVADRFHLVQLANDMVTEVRQHATSTVRGRRGRKTDPEWAHRRRLLTGHERLQPEAFARMWNALIDQGDVGIDVLHACPLQHGQAEPAPA